MDEAIRILLLAAATAVTIAALLTTLTYLLPVRVERARQSLENNARRSFLIGLVNAIFFGLLAALLAQGGDFLGLLALIILLILLGLAAIGLAGLLLILQERVYPSGGGATGGGSAVDGYPWLQMRLRTAALLALALLAPLVGWFVLFPLLLITCLGAGITVVFRRRRTVATEL